MSESEPSRPSAAADSSASPTLGARAFAALQYVLPQHAISRLVMVATRSRSTAFKNALIRGFVRLYDPDLSDAEQPSATEYESFNAFFTRALRPGARPAPQDPIAIASPVDGTISEIGRIDSNRLLQAKGHDYTLDALLAGRSEWISRFHGGYFATIYLAPYNYHRIHMATAGQLREAWYVPGRLFSVNAGTAALVPGLFARNERVVLTFADDSLSHAIVLVGALNVGCIETVWHGVVSPCAQRVPAALTLPRPARSIAAVRGDELGRFNMGSTVILLFPRQAIDWAPNLRAGMRVRVGQSLGRQSISVAAAGRT